MPFGIGARPTSRTVRVTFKSRGKPPHIRLADRAFWLVLRRVWARWRDVLVIVKPDTVVRWHRGGTVSRYLRGLRRRPEARQSWLTFLRNHREVIAAMDLFVACTATFRLRYVLFVIRHGRRRERLHLSLRSHSAGPESVGHAG
jgi:hypothetical protein